jgi:hypothetical protein
MAKAKKTEQITAYLSEDTWKKLTLLEPIWPYPSRAAFFDDAIRKALNGLLDSDKGLQKRILRALEEHINALEKI